MKLTDAKLKSIKPKNERFILWDPGHTGLGIRVTPAGKKTFIFTYRFQGKSRMWSIGPYPRVSLVAARLKAAQAKDQLTQGIDPGAVKIETRRAERSAPSVKDLMDEYIEKYAKVRKKSWREDERILNKDVVPEWGRRKAKDITRRDVVVLLDSIVERGAGITANRTLAVVRRMFNFALDRFILETSPCVAVRAPSKENQWDRVLTEKEIRKLWTGLDKSDMVETIRLAVKFQLATLQRKGEVLSAEWKEFSLSTPSNAWWVIPAEKSKNGFPHRVPLNEVALEILEELKRLTGESRWLFPGRREDTSLRGQSMDHAFRRNKETFGVEGVRPHDLRRTGASLMAGAGVPRLVVGKILNHVESGVTAVYDRHSYDAEKRQAMDQWGERLNAILEEEDENANEEQPGGEVIQLKS